MKKLLLAVAMVAALGSCSKNEAFLNESESNAIGFETFTSGTSKATAVDYSTNGYDSQIFTTTSMQTTGFGVYGFYTKTNWSLNEATITPNVMFNQEIKYDESYSVSTTDWNYSPVKYWSNTTTDYYSFFAYAPYSATPTMIEEDSDNDDSGAPSLKLTLRPAATTVDFVAGQVINTTKAINSGLVNFNLKHQTTRVAFSAKTSETLTLNGESETTICVTKMRARLGGTNDSFMGEGVYTFDDATTTTENKTNHANDGVWSDLKTYNTLYSSIVYDFSAILNYDSSGELIGDDTDGYDKSSGANVSNTDTNYTNLFADGKYLFLLPPNGSTGLTNGTHSIVIEITYDIVTKDDALDNGYSITTNTATIDLGDTATAGTMKQGYAYNYQLTIGLNRIEVSAKVIDWDTSEEITSTQITF